MERKNDLIILPGRGLSSVLFGMTVREVEESMGRCPSVLLHQDGGERTIEMRYVGVSLFFDQSDDFRLSVIEVDDQCPCRLFKKILFPTHRNDLIDLLQRNLPSSALAGTDERQDDSLEEKVINLPALWTTFYFNADEELKGVNWSVLVNDDDKIEWARFSLRTQWRPRHSVLANVQILPGIGLGPLHFGMTIEEVEEMTGMSPSRERVEDGEYSYITLDYLTQGVRLFFDEDKEKRLSSIEVNDYCECTLFGESLFPKTEEQIHAILQAHVKALPDQGEFAERRVDRDIEEISLNVRGLSLTFYFDLDKFLRQVHWGVVFNSEDEIIWPEKAD